MNPRAIPILCSAVLHLALAGLWWQRSAVETGMATGQRDSNPMHMAFITIRSDSMSQPENISATSLLHSRKDAHAAIPMQEQATNKRKDTSSGYLPAGRLTRAPHPITDIDLNDHAINNLSFTGELELTLMIDVDGTVADIRVPAQIGSAKIFAAHVAERFRLARFSPGEIDGKPVRSEMKIKIVSERPAANAGQQ